VRVKPRHTIGGTVLPMLSSEHGNKGLKMVTVMRMMIETKIAFTKKCNVVSSIYNPVIIMVNNQQ